MKIVKELKEQYAYVWWWLLEQGLFIATIIVNSFLLVVWVVFMCIFVFLIRWYSKH